MRKRYLIRLDDACPTMNHAKWQQMEILLDKYGIKPMVGVIPNNEDSKQMVDAENPNFWCLVQSWCQKDWAIALHGYNHCYTSQGGMKGLNPMWSKSEFAGLPLEEQKDKIREGVKILREYGINPKYFFAPSHTFDDNTLEALKFESDIRIISDGIALKPFKRNGIVFIPQFFGHCVNVLLPGIYTFCFHPNTMTNKDFERLEPFLINNKEKFFKWEDLSLNDISSKRAIDIFLAKLFFAYRKCRGFK